MIALATTAVCILLIKPLCGLTSSVHQIQFALDQYNDGIPSRTATFDEKTYAPVYHGHMSMLTQLAKRPMPNWIGKLQNNIGLLCK
jgi:hypothetical protein